MNVHLLGVRWMSVGACLAVLAACSSQDGSAPKPDAEGIEVTLSATRDVVGPSNPATITVTVTNHGTEKASYGQGSSGCRTVLVVRVQGEDVGAGEPRVCTADVIAYELDPGESYSEPWPWAGDYFESDKRVQLGPGTYELRGRAGGFVSEPISIRVEP